ncbi:MAG TPA: DUF1289 domain-containing protein [archaeon]|nr:DUF1289 domain-containing protein [archaeon]
MKKRLLPADEIRNWRALSGKEKKEKWRELKARRLELKYGGKFVNPGHFFTIGNVAEREEALRKGQMIFRGRKGEEFDVALNIHGYQLIGVVGFKEKIYSLRYIKREQGAQPSALICPFEINTTHAIEEDRGMFFAADPVDMGHIQASGLEKSGLILPLLQIATEIACAKTGKASAGIVFEKFADLFSRVGYKTVKQVLMTPDVARDIARKRPGMKLIPHALFMEYSGKPLPENNLDTHYRFVAIDPHSGEIKSYYYPKQ